MKNYSVNSTHKNPVHAQEAHASTGDTYGFVSSERVLETFAAAGWRPVSQQVVAPRNVDKLGYQKHLVRLENDAYPEVPGLAGAAHCRPQLVFLNSHDKASSMRLHWGMFRFVCTNGLVMGETVGSVRLNHSSKVQERLVLAIDGMLSTFPKLVEQVTALRTKQLTDAATKHLVKTVFDARLDAVKNLRDVEYRLPLLRRGDVDGDAFTVFNRVQETVIRGGIHYTYDREVGSGTSKYKRLSDGKTRKVTAIEESVRLNTLAYETALALV